MTDSRPNPRPVTPPPPDRRVWSERLVRISGFRRFLPTQRAQRWFPFIVLFASLAIVAVVTFVLNGIIRRWDDARFAQNVDQAHREITRRVDDAVSIVRATSSLSLWESLNQESFRTFVAKLGPMAQHHGVQSVGYCVRFNSRSKAVVQKKLEDEYGAGFAIVQQHSSDEGFAILFVEPQETNQWAVGWDLYDEKLVRRVAMDEAKKNDAPRASRFTFLPEDQSLTARVPGMYVFAPVYAPTSPSATPGERATALIGYSFCAVVLNRLFDGVFPTARDQITFQVYDGVTTEDSTRVYGGGSIPDGHVPRREQRVLGDHGMVWSVEYQTLPEFDAASSKSLIPWIAIGGVVCSLLLFFATFALTHARMDAERIEGVLREKTMELARSNTDLERFAYVASHDLREPLRMVTAYVQLLEKRYADKLDKDAREFIGYAVDGAGRMNEFLDGLLYLSRVSRDPGVHDPIDADRAFKTAVGNLKHTIASANASVTADHPLPFVRINETHLLQLFQNLIGNAIKFQKDGSPRVHVAAAREGDLVKFSVKDNGIGIDPAFSEQVFEVFRRLHTRDHYPGSGLGLAICKRVVEQRGGKIWFEANAAPETGTTFFFTLPGG